jgi:hypothetical protein
MPWLSDKQIRNRAVLARSAVEGTSDAAYATIERVGVDHRRGDIFVTEQFLDGPDVVAVFQQVGSEGMSLMPSSA